MHLPMPDYRSTYIPALILVEQQPELRIPELRKTLLLIRTADSTILIFNDLRFSYPGIYDNFIQTDTPISPGNSGGPLHFFSSIEEEQRFISCSRSGDDLGRPLNRHWMNCAHRKRTKG